ncbi:MAG: 23S rRNA (uracil(1939)-C(5))-methyltransferase RlmD [Quinella sp. 2Q5]|nr:23S rRNA (uracil(1939)-C(5))-methyltransferase RlmD [Quinella sp. 2Q5]
MPSIKIHGLGSSGEGVGKVGELIVFVEGALPDEEVIAEIITRKKNYAVGRLIEIVKPSSERVKPFCPLFGDCGGCQLQHMSYAAQLQWKRQQVVDAVERIGKLEGVEIFPTLGMENPLRYRNKMQFPVGRSKAGLVIGCYARGSHNIIDATSCPIQREGNDRILNAVRKVAAQFNLSPYDEDTHKGFLRHVMGRVGCNGQLMVVLVTATKNFPAEKNFVRALRRELPDVTSIQQNVQTFRNNVILGRETRVLYGKPTISDEIGGLKFNISARSFFQVNTAQAEVLYRTALDFAEMEDGEIIVDAYCGTGTIGLFMARRAHRVYGTDIVSSAIADAKRNARENNIRNVEFFVGDAVKVLPRLATTLHFPDVIVTDPPRAGCDRKVLETFAAMEADKIIYVSCNPATLARDLSTLGELGYRTTKIQPVDMFPFTAHVEAVAQIVRIDRRT